MRRMLILHASVGTGHTTAARALAKVFRMRQVEQVWCEDALDYGSKIFREIYAGSYLELSEKMPTLWAYFYTRTDQNETELSKELRTLIDRIGVTDLVKLVRQRRPDAVICTHFLPLNLLAREKRKRRLPLPLYCVVTDGGGPFSTLSLAPGRAAGRRGPGRPAACSPESGRSGAGRSP